MIANDDTGSIIVDESEAKIMIYLSEADVVCGKLPYATLCDTLLEVYNIIQEDHGSKRMCMMIISTTNDNRILEMILEREGLILDTLCIHVDGAEDANTLETLDDARIPSKSFFHERGGTTRPSSIVRNDLAIDLSRIAEQSKDFDLTAITICGSSVEGLDLDVEGAVLSDERTDRSSLGLAGHLS